MRKHLMLNQQRLDNPEAISDEIEDSCEDIEEFNREAKQPLRCVALVVGADEKVTE